MATIASLNIDLRANVVKFTRGLNKGIQKVKQFGASVAAVGKRMARFGAIAAAAAAGGMALLVRSQFDAIDTLGKMSGSLGIATDKLAGLQLAAQIGGVSTEQLNKSLIRMVKSVADANNGLSTAKRAFDALGLNSEVLAKLAPDEQFRLIAEAMSNLATQTDRTGVAMDIFGRQGAALLNVLSGGAAGIDEMQRVAEQLGIALDGVEVAQVELANDAMTKLKSLFIGIARQIAVQLAPFLEGLTDRFTDVGTASSGAGKVVARVFSFIANVFATIGTAVQVVGAAFTAVQGGFARFLQFMIGGVNKLFDLLFSAADALNFTLPETVRNFREFLGEFEVELGNTADAKFEQAVGAFENIFNGDTFGQEFLDGLEAIQNDSERRAKAIAEGRFSQLTDAAGAATAGAGGTKAAGTPGALERGTSAAFSAANKNRQTQLQIEQNQLAVQRQMRDKLDQIARNVAPLKPAMLS